MITCLVLSPTFSQDGIALVGTMEDGILNTNNHGHNWLSWNFGLLDLSVLSLAISPDFARDETVFAGTETGIFRSTNGGRAWREVELPIGYEPVISLAASPAFAVDKTLFAGTETQGILRSQDGGAAWEKCAAIPEEGPVNSILLSPAFEHDSTLLALSNGLVWASRDAGHSWEALWPDLAEAEKEVSALFAPRGFAPGSPVWLGFYDGEVLPTCF